MSPPVVVARAERGITVENRAGRPLLNIRLVIEGRDSGTAFVYTLPTLDTGATREVPFADFRTEDGTLFEPGFRRREAGQDHRARHSRQQLRRDDAVGAVARTTISALDFTLS